MKKSIIYSITFFTIAMTSIAQAKEPTVVRLATHDSFVMSNELIKQFQTQTGLTLKIIRLGDAGALTIKLVLTKSNPIADAMFGIDNTFSGVATSNNIIQGSLHAVDFGDICFNYDIAWFKKKNVNPPSSWRDLTKAAYKNLTVISNPKISSPGMAFLATTYAGFSSADQTSHYWSSLKSNGVKVDSSWDDAYFVDFSGSSGKGTRPIVLSYTSSPSAEIGKDGAPRTASLLKDCFRQIEYVGVLKNSLAPKAAQQLISFMLSDAFQRAMPASMYVYPINPKTPLPVEWVKYSQAATSVIGSNLDIQGNRSKWLKAWSAVFGS
jgi:thiamine transport system substrate-binding protein